jgi:uncharacterized phage-associated protein
MSALRWVKIYLTTPPKQPKLEGDVTGRQTAILQAGNDAGHSVVPWAKKIFRASVGQRSRYPVWARIVAVLKRLTSSNVKACGSRSKARGAVAMGLISARDVAKYILAHFRAKATPINNLKLQKLLYYTQAWHAAIFGTPLFADKIEAWVHGPVVPCVYQDYKSFWWSPITSDVSYEAPPEAAELIDNVLVAYGELNAWDLEKLSHSEDPWKRARAGIPPDQASKSIITLDSMKAFYS